MGTWKGSWSAGSGMGVEEGSGACRKRFGSISWQVETLARTWRSARWSRSFKFILKAFEVVAKVRDMDGFEDETDGGRKSVIAWQFTR
jgi:hypothetical protein